MNENRILLGMLTAALCLPVAQLAPGLRHFEASSTYTLMLYFFRACVACVPALWVLALTYLLCQRYRLCSWWLVSFATALVMATVMWPFYGLPWSILIGGFFAGLVFYLLALFPYSGGGPPVHAPSLFMFRIITIITSITSVTYIYVKLRIVELEFENLDYFTLAFKPHLNLISMETVKPPTDLQVLFPPVQGGYFGREYFLFITHFGWVLFPLLAMISSACYGYLNFAGRHDRVADTTG